MTSPQILDRPIRPRHLARTAVWLACLAVFAFAVWDVDIDWGDLVDAPQKLWHLGTLMFLPPDFGKFGQALSATMLSVAMAWFGTLLGVAVSLPLGLLATRGAMPIFVRWPVRGLLAILRAVPEVVTAVLMLSVTGLTAFTGALAIAIGSIGTLGKWTYETFESVERGPIEATMAAGATRWQQLRWGVWTTARPDVLAFWLYRFEISVRASAILGLIGAGGIGKMLVDNTQFRIWDTVGMLMIVVVVVTMLIDQVSATLRSKIITGRWPRGVRAVLAKVRPQRESPAAKMAAT